MGMISRFIDKLRDTAMRVEIFLDGSTDAIPTDTHEQLRNAADIIRELRDDLQRANYAVQNAEHDESMAWDRLRKAEAENAKLRELCKSMRCALADFDDKVYLAALDETLIGAGFNQQELRIEANDD